MSRATDATRASTLTLQDLFRRSARLFADRVAVVDGDTRLTYRAIDERARKLASAMIDAGMKPKDRIAILSEPRADYVEIYIAAAYANLTVLALNSRLHPSEITWTVESAKPRILFASPNALDRVEKRDAGSPRLIVFGDDYEAFRDAGSPDVPAIDVDGEDIHNVLFTSGTTGRPKGAMISHRAAATRAIRLAQWFRLGPDDGFIGWLPLYHCAGDESLYATFLTGGRYATFGKADVVEMYKRIESDRLSWTLLLPGVLTDFLNHPQSGNFDLGSLRFGIGYGNMMPEVVRTLTSKFRMSFFDAFGQTETSYLVAHVEALPGEALTLRKQPSPHMDIRIVDDDMNEQPVGVPGECVVRGPSVMSGYLDDEEATAEAFRGGYLHTGDVFVRNEDGTLTFTDRLKYLIKTGGENVYPAEIELLVAGHPAVEEVCVFGVQDDRWGETIKAAVVLRPEQSVSRRELADFCRGKLAGYKQPRHIEFLRTEELPRSVTGKILRHELAARPLKDDDRI